jgi:rhodanese-related sulfurtransferase
MKKWAIIIAVALMASSGLVAAGALAAEAARMDKDELKAKLGNPDVVIIDVRSHTDWLFSGDKIKGALRENYRDFEGWYAKYPKDKTIVLYCA